NAVCAQCHSPAGNQRFPTLNRANYDNASHHFHPDDTAGAQCVGCHMIERLYMGIDGRRDHSFRVPRPDLSDETGAPNVCTECHEDRNAAWAAAEIAQWFPDSDRRGPHFSQIFAAARRDPVATAENLLKIVENGRLPGLIRASALDLLHNIADEEIAARVAPLIGDGNPLVRAAAIAVQRGAPPIDRVQRLVSALEDPVRSVRIAAARGFLDAPVAGLPTRIAEAAENATGEWRASLLAKADYPETHMVLGGAALVLRNPRAAEHAFRETVRLDPQRLEAWTMIARILAASGDLDGAREALDDALAANPSSEGLQSLLRELNEMNLR
ncbi:MAG: tetratricopeptide repeat protein, partial [Alphaproteobacteria bacterium]|nr:tetratricopeptide repeat protein [Alphaproteobacteria bacterium]